MKKNIIFAMLLIIVLITSFFPKGSTEKLIYSKKNNDCNLSIYSKEFCYKEKLSNKATLEYMDTNGFLTIKSSIFGKSPMEEVINIDFLKGDTIVKMYVMLEDRSHQEINTA